MPRPRKKLALRQNDKASVIIKHSDTVSDRAQYLALTQTIRVLGRAFDLACEKVIKDGLYKDKQEIETMLKALEPFDAVDWKRVCLAS